MKSTCQHAGQHLILQVCLFVVGRCGVVGSRINYAATSSARKPLRPLQYATQPVLPQLLLNRSPTLFQCSDPRMNIEY
ncbi:hypothetical protein EDD17DRAFT_1527498 [Pisolithus thermaeus]|nr:hypothetical protein EDD17DRAFT_1527498 [Pisolithus thermaeus]